LTLLFNISHQLLGKTRNQLLEIVKKLDNGCGDIVVVDPKSLNVNQQVKKNQITSPRPRKYIHSGHKVLRVKELVQFLQAYLEED